MRHKPYRSDWQHEILAFHHVDRRSGCFQAGKQVDPCRRGTVTSVLSSSQRTQRKCSRPLVVALLNDDSLESHPSEDVIPATILCADAPSFHPSPSRRGPLRRGPLRRGPSASLREALPHSRTSTIGERTGASQLCRDTVSEENAGKARFCSHLCLHTLSVCLAVVVSVLSE